MAAAFPVPAAAQSLEEVRSFSIASQSIADALILFSRQSGVQIISASTGRQRSSAVKGKFPARKAISLILDGTGLKWKRVDDHSIIVGPKSHAAPGAADQPAHPGDLKFGGHIASIAVPPSDIVVTGSRIVGEGTPPTPSMAVSTDMLAAHAPGSIAEGLYQLPVFQGSISAQQTQLVTTNRVRSGNYLNLRNLGPQRLLVLQDGYRLPPSGNNGGVDTNIIPQMLVERVEVVTGGASAVYGSDAVSGVVNYILDKRFTGLKTLAQAGYSTYGDAFSYRLGAAGGVALAEGRLRIQASAEYYSNDGIPRRSARPGGADLWVTGAFDPTLQAGPFGTADNPYVDYRNVTQTSFSPGGLIVSGPSGLINQQFLPNGTLAPFNPGASIGRPGYGQGGDGPDGCVDCTYVPRTTTGQIFGRASMDFGDGIEWFGQLSFNTATNAAENVNLFSGEVEVFADNPYLRQQLTPAQLDAMGGGSVTLRRYFREWDSCASRLGAIPSKQSMRSITVMTGLSGRLFGDWKWETIFTYGLTDLRSRTQEIRGDRFLAAVDSAAGPDGSPVCRVTLVAPDRFRDCRPLNIFGVGRADPGAVQWVLDESRWRTRNSLSLGGLNISGSLLSVPAGPVWFVLGGEIRRQHISQTSNSDPAVPVDFTGIRGGNGGVFRSTNVGVADGAYTIREIYAETTVPLLKGVPFADSLEVNGAYRYTHYSTSGSVETFKLGAAWQPIPDISFRGAYSRDVRAPSLFELFAGQTLLQNPVFDSVTNMTHIVLNRGGGDPNLTPERAGTITLGAALRPRSLPGLTGSLYYFDIKIKNAIATPGNTFQIFVACAANPANPLCNLIKRDSSGKPVEVLGISQNLSGLSIKGIDADFRYSAKLGKGRLTGRLVATYLMSYRRKDGSDVASVEYAGTADLPGFLASTYPLPRLRGNIDLSYSSRHFTIGLQERMIGAYAKSHIQHYLDNRVEPVFYTDIYVSKPLALGGTRPEFFLTVNNLFNRKGPFFVTDQNPGTQLPTARSVYDIVGRYATIGIRARF